MVRGAPKSALPPCLLLSAKPPVSAIYSHLPSLIAGTWFSHPLSLLALRLRGQAVISSHGACESRSEILDSQLLLPQPRGQGLPGALPEAPPLCQAYLQQNATAPLLQVPLPFQEAFQECSSAHQAPFQSLTADLCESDLQAAWGSLRAGLGLSCHPHPLRAEEEIFSRVGRRNRQTPLAGDHSAYALAF